MKAEPHVPNRAVPADVVPSIRRREEGRRGETGDSERDKHQNKQDPERSGFGSRGAIKKSE